MNPDYKFCPIVELNPSVYQYWFQNDETMDHNIVAAMYDYYMFDVYANKCVLELLNNIINT